MFMNLGDVAAGSTLYCPFPTYNAAGASVTITGLATTDIEIYKNGSTTQRSSDAGYALLDTDGIDFDSNTGIHGFSVDLSDNTDAGFYAAGGVYWLVVASITADSQTVNFGYYFTIDKNNVLRPTTAGRSLDVSSTGAAGIDLNNIELPAGPIPALGILEGSGTASAMQAGSTSSTAVLRSATAFADDLINNTVIEVTGGTGAGQVRLIVDWVSSTDTATVNPNWTTTPDNTSTYIVRAAPPAPTTAAYMPSVMLGADALTDAALAADAVTAIQSGLATQASVNTIDDLLDSEMPALTIAVADLPTNAELATALGTADDAVLAALAILTTTLNATRYQKNTGSQKVFFILVDSTDHVTREPGITVTATRSLDGAAFGAASGAVTEVASGVYYLTPAAGDINGDDVVFRFTGTGCDPVELHVVTY